MTQPRRHPRPTPKAAKKQPKKAVSRRRGPILRVLPLMIVVAVCVLGFRVTIVVQDMRGMMTSVNVGQSAAIAQEDAGARIEEFEDAALNGTETEDETEGAGGGMDGDTETADATEADGLLDGDEAGESLNLEAQSFTPSELDLLQRLSERREKIDAQEKALAAQEAMLRAAEARIDGKIAELQELEQSLVELVAEADAQQKAKIEQLVRIYGAMKPKDAARIFNDLDMPILITVVEMMKENKVAPILAQMDAIKATAVTEALSSRKLMPGMEGDSQG
jgi:flagellar motility protein MotE (MotC chaperone)